jgi:hypothetical protein
MSEYPVFPIGIAQIIAEYCAEVKLHDWIQPKPLTQQSRLYANPLAFDAGMLNLDHIDPRSPDFGNKSLCATPDSPCMCLQSAFVNAALKEFIFSAHGKTHVERSYYDKIDMVAYAWCVKNCGLHKASTISMDEIDELYKEIHLLESDENEELYSENPMLIKDILISRRVNSEELSTNPHPLAIEFLRLNWDWISTKWLASNPGIFRLHIDKKLVKLLSRRKCMTCGR